MGKNQALLFEEIFSGAVEDKLGLTAREQMRNILSPHFAYLVENFRKTLLECIKLHNDRVKVGDIEKMLKKIESEVEQVTKNSLQGVENPRKKSASDHSHKSPNWDNVQNVNVGAKFDFLEAFEFDDEKGNKVQNQFSVSQPPRQSTNPFEDEEEVTKPVRRNIFEDDYKTAVSSHVQDSHPTRFTSPPQSVRLHSDFREGTHFPQFARPPTKIEDDRQSRKQEIYSMVSKRSSVPLYSINKPPAQEVGLKTGGMKQNKMLITLEAIGAGNRDIENNFNYFIDGTSHADELLLTGHEQSVLVNRFNGKTKVVKHQQRMVFFYIKFKIWEIFFCRNEEVKFVSNLKKFASKHKFKGSYLNEKWDNRARGVHQVGSLLYFLTLESDVVVYNLDLLLSNLDAAPNYLGDTLERNVEAFIVDHFNSLWTINLQGYLSKSKSSSHCLQIKTPASEDPYLFNCLEKLQHHFVATAYCDRIHNSVVYLLNDSPQLLDQYSLESQPSQIHLVRGILQDTSHYFILISQYALHLFSVVKDQLIPIQTNLMVAENIINSIFFDDFTKQLFVADTRKSIKVFKLA